MATFVVDVASGDMPEEAVFRAGEGENPAALQLARMGRSKTRNGAITKKKGRLLANKRS